MQLTKNVPIFVCWMKRPRCHHEIYDVVVRCFVKNIFFCRYFDKWLRKARPFRTVIFGEFADLLVYLIFYNTACMLGWFYLWVLQYQFYTSGFAFDRLVITRSGDFWALIGTPLKWVQTAAVMEIVHSMLGLVRSPVMTTALQGIFPFLFVSL